MWQQRDKTTIAQRVTNAVTAYRMRFMDTTPNICLVSPDDYAALCGEGGAAPVIEDVKVECGERYSVRVQSGVYWVGTE
jgi:hypothetical protein